MFDFLKYHTTYLFQSKIVNWKIKSPYLKKLVLRIPDQGNVFTVLKMFSLELRSVKCFPPNLPNLSVSLQCFHRFAGVAEIFFCVFASRAVSAVSLKYFYKFSPINSRQIST